MGKQLFEVLYEFVSQYREKLLRSRKEENRNGAIKIPQ